MPSIISASPRYCHAPGPLLCLPSPPHHWPSPPAPATAAASCRQPRSRPSSPVSRPTSSFLASSPALVLPSPGHHLCRQPATSEAPPPCPPTSAAAPVGKPFPLIEQGSAPGTRDPDAAATASLPPPPCFLLHRAALLVLPLPRLAHPEPQVDARIPSSSCSCCAIPASAFPEQVHVVALPSTAASRQQLHEHLFGIPLLRAPRE